MFRLALVIAYLFAFAYFGRWREAFYSSDSFGYYLHLPATLLYGDAGNYDKSIAAWRQYAPIAPDPKADQYGLRTTPLGKTIIKYPVGTALLQSPFWGLAHLWCKVTGSHPADGFSPPYVLLVGLSAVFYGLLGLFFLENALQGLFPKKIIWLTVAAIGVATHLFFFCTYTPGMAHPIAFAAVSALLFFTRHWYASGKAKHALGLGISLGLLCSVRVTDAIVGLIPLLWGLPDAASLRSRMLFFKANARQALLAATAAFLCVLPQLLYWKFSSGQWLFNSYQGESFHWAKPMIISGLWSFKNGWFVYTPIMLLAVLGLLIAFFRPLGTGGAERIALWPIALVLVLHVYVSYSWWCWNYINGFGSRPMIDIYALLALPLAVFFHWAHGHKVSNMMAWCVAAFFALLNVFQTWQTAAFVLWSENANGAYYWSVFGQNKLSRAALIALETGEKQADSSKINKIKTLFINPLSDTTALCQAEYCLTTAVQTDTSGIRAGDWLALRAQASIASQDYERNIHKLARLVLDLRNADGSECKYNSISITSKIGNPDNIPWHAGQADIWGEAVFWVQVPHHFRPGGTAKAYIWNSQGQKILLKNISLELWR